MDIQFSQVSSDFNQKLSALSTLVASINRDNFEEKKAEVARQLAFVMGSGQDIIDKANRMVIMLSRASINQAENRNDRPPMAMNDSIDKHDRMVTLEKTPMVIDICNVRPTQRVKNSFMRG